MAQRTYVALPALLLLLMVTVISGDDSTKDKPTRGRQPRNVAERIRLTDAEKAAALKFAEKNHPELAQLIAKLKENQPTQYRDALKHLNRAVVRFERLGEKQDDRYLLQLAIWKIDSRVGLEVARVSVRSKQQTKLLEQLLLRRRRKRLELYRFDLARLRSCQGNRNCSR